MRSRPPCLHFDCSKTIHVALYRECDVNGRGPGPKGDPRDCPDPRPGVREPPPQSSACGGGLPKQQIGVRRSARAENREVPAGLVILVDFLVGMALLAVAASDRLVHLLSRRSVALAALPLLSAVLLTVYVFGEDSYRRSGISRWEAYQSPGGALGPMFVLSVALMVGCAALLLYSGLRGRDHLLRATAFVGGLASLVLLTATTIGFSLN